MSKIISQLRIQSIQTMNAIQKIEIYVRIYMYFEISEKTLYAALE